MFWVLLSSAAVLGLWQLRRRWLSSRQMQFAAQLKTNIRMLPIMGHSYKFLGNEEEQMRSYEDLGRDAVESGGISKLMLFNQLFINVVDPVVAEILLGECLEKHSIMKMVNVVVGDVSIIAPVPIWRHRRKVVAPLFNSKNLIRFVEIFSEHSKQLVENLNKEVGRGPFSFWEYIAGCNVNIVCETIMGLRIDFRNSEFLRAADELWAISTFRISQPLIWSPRVFRLMPCYSTAMKHKRTIFNFVMKIIDHKQKARKETTNQSTAPRIESSFLDYQLDTSEGTRRKFSDRELVEEALLLVVAGYDTTASTVAFTALMLAAHQEVQEKVFKELLEVFGDSDRVVVHDDLSQLPYLEAVIKETLRLYPVVPVIVRQVDEDVQLPSGLTVVKGCGVIVNIWGMHRNPTYWGPDADHFRPERFLDSTLPHPGAFMPFSIGARGCVGYRYAMLSIKTVLVHLVRRYRLLAAPGVEEPLRTKFNMMLRHVGDYPLQLEAR